MHRSIRRQALRRALPFAPAAALLVSLAGGEAHAGPRVGFVLPRESAADPGPEARAALELGGRLAGAVPVSIADGGRLVDLAGAPIEAPAVLWIHLGDAVDPPASFREVTALDTLRKHAASRGGLLLTGAALSLVRDLGIEDAIPRRFGPGKDGYVAELIPESPDHPVFHGLEVRGIRLDESVGGNPRDCAIPIVDSGFPATADFHGSGGPLGGTVLGRARSGQEEPLVEYRLGEGRVIVLGWRLPHFGAAPNAHRSNLERLTANLLAYLGEPGRWVSLERPASPSSPPASRGIEDRRWTSIELALRDLIATHGEAYPRGPEHLSRLLDLRRAHDAALGASAAPGEAALAEIARISSELESLRSEALLENPLLGFGRLLLVERAAGRPGLPANWEANTELPKAGYDGRIAILSPVRPDGSIATVYAPEDGRFVGDLELHFDATRLLFSMPRRGGPWRIHELRLDGSAPRELPLIDEPDVDDYDACWLPDGRVVFTSTATFAGVPCVNGSSHVTNLYLREHDGSIRQLTVDQEHNWCPTVLNDGRVMYLRWEYTDLPHSNSRRLFRMNPDGTGQTELYGSNSFFPNSFFYARPLPDHPTRVIGIATGHHGVARAGRLLILDPALSSREAEGVVQEIPGRGRTVEALIRDELVAGAWPQFLHPYPLSDKHFLVSSRADERSVWGIWLVDVFDNRVLVKEIPGRGLFEPVPILPRAVPPAIPDRVERGRRDAVVLLSDVYAGGGLAGIPRGTVKALRLVSYHFGYRGMGGLLGSIGMDGPWDPKRILGTVPVEPDGSACFRVPANTPIAVQPLDEAGRALQLMRSWFTAMPGERLSCVGCHEPTQGAAPNRPSLASGRPPSEIEPWFGPVRGFSFAREVQPVLDRHCVGCHGDAAGSTGGGLDLRGDRKLEGWSSSIAGNAGAGSGGRFSASYAELHRFVRRPGIESDIRLLTPLEFHASTTELIQILRKGHHGADLDAESWARLNAWIDLNAPYHGTWSEIVGPDAVRHVAARRRAMSRLYAGVDEDPEAIPPAPGPAAPRPPSAAVPSSAAPRPAGAGVRGRAARSSAARAPTRRESVEIAPGVALELVLVPSGELLMGDEAGEPDETPLSPVRIDRPFWMGRYEVTNEQFAAFDRSHDSRVEPMHGYQFGIHGYPVNQPRQPVVRVSWERARAFCAWLAERTGRPFSLPTEAQWEWACRAGTETAMWFGDPDSDYSASANLGDVRLREYAIDTYVRVRLVPDPNRFDDWVPRDRRFDDGSFVSAPVGSYRESPWGLCDMHGNVWEWTRTAYRPYPYREDDGRDDPSLERSRVVRGGSWYDRPHRCRSSFRLSYAPYQRVFNVGFRVVCDAEPEVAGAPPADPR